MNGTVSYAAGALVAVWLWAGASAAVPVGTAFTYQGSVNKDGTAYHGSCDLFFRLYDAAVGGTPSATRSRSPAWP